MLGHYYRFRIQNTQNQAITCALTARLWKFASDGSITWSSEVTLIASGSVAATTGTTASSNYDNSTDKWIGAELTLSTTAAVTTNGTGAVAVTLERSTDGGTTWPTARQGEFVGGYTVTAADTTSARLKNLTLD
jgi:hypothetical protein